MKFSSSFWGLLSFFLFDRKIIILTSLQFVCFLQKKIVLYKVDNSYLKKLNLFLHKICLLTEFIGYLRKIIYLSYEILFFC